MLPETREIVEKTLVEKQSEANREFVTKIEKFLLTEETQYFFFNDEAEFDQFTQLIGHDAFTYSSIRSYSYESHSTESLHKENEAATFKGEGSIHGILNYLGDIGINLEFCNDFKIHMIVDLDNDSTVFYQYESSENAQVCADCTDLEEYDQITGSNRFYSCEHETSEYYSRYYAVLRKYIPKEDLGAVLTFGEM